MKREQLRRAQAVDYRYGFRHQLKHRTPSAMAGFLMAQDHFFLQANGMEHSFSKSIDAKGFHIPQLREKSQ